MAMNKRRFQAGSGSPGATASGAVDRFITAMVTSE
jgi:hypothetical protein